MTIGSQLLCFESRREYGVGLIHTHLASSSANASRELASSPRSVGFITRDLHPLISRQRCQTMRCGLNMLFLASKMLCMQRISCVDVQLTTWIVLSLSGRFGGGRIGWSQLQLASPVSPPCFFCKICINMFSRGSSHLFCIRPSNVSRWLWKQLWLHQHIWLSSAYANPSEKINTGTPSYILKFYWKFLCGWYITCMWCQMQRWCIFNVTPVM